jgi:transposase
MNQKDNAFLLGVMHERMTYHYARAFDNRGRELTKRVFSFANDIEGFNTFNQWIEKLRTENGKTEIMIGCEPTGHYWFALSKYVTDHKMNLVMVNPFSVKKIKELDDNSPKKTDAKDPKTIAKLVVVWKILHTVHA